MKCAHCGKTFSDRRVGGTCCSARCSESFAKSINNPSEVIEPPYAIIDWEVRFQVFCADFGVLVEFTK